MGYMRAIILFMNLIIVLTSCSKSVDTPKVYTDAKGTTLSFTITQWTATRNSTIGGNVTLRLTGSTNAELVSVTTFGDVLDGLISDVNVPLDAKKNFNKIFVISSTSTAVQTTQFDLNTEVKAYRGSDTLIVPLNSGKLRY
jgi:hypothetical protein